MSNIKLYYSPGACSLAPHILLHETGHAFTTKQEGRGASDELRALNPKAKVPVLLIDDTVITENIAIQTAISNLAPEKSLLGAPGSLESIRILEWLSWLATSVHATGFGLYFRPFRFTTSSDEKTHEEVKARAKELLKDAFDLVEEKLTGVHAVGDRFTAADAYLYVFYRWGSTIWDMEATFPKYAALAASVQARESTIKALKEEGL
jgi:glutathione S-transferase